MDAATAIAEAQAWLDAHPFDPEADRKTWLSDLVDSGWAAPSWPADEFGRGLPPKVARSTDDVFRSADVPGWGQDVTNLIVVSETQMTGVTPAASAAGPAGMGYSDGGGCLAILPNAFDYQ